MVGSMGAGLMVGTGTALSRGTRCCPHTSMDPEICTGGPLGLLLGYIFVGVSDSFFIILILE
jgi:amino acid permease